MSNKTTWSNRGERKSAFSFDEIGEARVDTSHGEDQTLFWSLLISIASSWHTDRSKLYEVPKASFIK